LDFIERVSKHDPALADELIALLNSITIASVERNETATAR
jgi:hypothetical protein